MDSPKMLSNRQKSHSSKGFALVIALSMMAFVVLLIVSMSLLIGVETANTSAALQQIRAKESAKLALNIALGELQKHAGPDQRVTTRAEIIGTGIPDSSRHWIGIWDTRNSNATPVWLVSGNNPSPQIVNSQLVKISQSYDANSDGDYSTSEDAPATLVPFQKIGDDIEIAWWVIDEGVKAPLVPVDGFTEDIDPLVEANYLDYNQSTLLTNRIQHDPKFDFPDLYDSSLNSSSEENTLRRAHELDQLHNISESLPIDKQASVEGELLHASSLNTHFVISNTLDGGLKQDFSYLKTIDASSVTLGELQSSYEDPDDLLAPQLARLVQLRANPTAGDADDMIGMQLDAPTITEAENESVQLRLAPVITEFQLSLGVAADDQGASQSAETTSSVYLVHKLYLEIWNPYAVPFLIGDPTMDTQRGYSDLRIEIENLPTYTIINTNNGQSVNGSIPTLSYKWSDYASRKILRPGMVFKQTLPKDNYAPAAAGSNKTGVELHSLPGTMLGKASDAYSGSFSFSSNPVVINIYALDNSSNEIELFRAEIEGYSAFNIDYDPSNRATYFKRRITSTSGQFGINHNSLETQGYAFATRFRMLDEQELPGNIQDISNLLSLYDIRQQSIEVDLSSWDMNDAWSPGKLLPYDFRLNDSDTDPGFFDPSESFKPADFFHYGANSGRQDRIARFIDFPTSEIRDMSALRSLQFRDYPMGAIGSEWGQSLNRFYDRYFFSTLPDPNDAIWDGKQALANPRITPHSQIPLLNSSDTGNNLLLKNGFNINSSSELSWRKILAGNSIPSSELHARFEQGAYPNPPELFTIPDTLKGAFVNHPQSAIFNLTEDASSPAYEFLTQKSTNNYIDRFSINSVDWQNNLQHPAFLQPIREISEIETNSLATSIVSEIKAFYAQNNRPPYSLSEYLESGIFQRAIDDNPGINNRENNKDQIPAHTPSSITQATLMNQLGTLAFVRSDTFTIRALAKYTNPFNGNISQALCEARVQRLPDVHEQAEFGRSFHILEFNWLNDSF